MVEIMIERVARAIAVSHYPDKEADVMWRHMVPDARAAIEAMREPTMFMLRSADNAIISDEMFESGPFEIDKLTWETMIDAALNEHVSG